MFVTKMEKKIIIWSPRGKENIKGSSIGRRNMIPKKILVVHKQILLKIVKMFILKDLSYFGLI